MEDLFYNYGVDVVIQVHGHSYERLWPQYKGVVLSKDYTNPKAPVQFITGAAERMHSENVIGSANKTGKFSFYHIWIMMKLLMYFETSYEVVGYFPAVTSLANPRPKKIIVWFR